ncbi:MAG: nitrogenase component 1 [Peptococcaceae bacterium]|nr:nitrogenase component 1 [Peptococcaceae bacterium]
MKDPAYITIEELAEIKLDPGRYTRIMPEKHLKYIAPGVDGLGICALSLQVPESAVLFIAPAGCARHVSMGAYRNGTQDRLYLLRVQEEELVNGSHLDRIPQAVEEILKKAEPKPRALFLCSSCVDTLLASDYETLARQMERRYGIRVRASYMDPIMFDSQKSPDNRIQCSMYAFVEKRKPCDGGVNLLGCGAPLNGDSELYPLLQKAGAGPVRHIDQTKTLDELDELGRAALNLVITPNAKMAAGQLKDRLKIPYLVFSVRWGLENIHQAYQDLGKALNLNIEDTPYLEQAREEIIRSAVMLEGKRVAIGKTIRGNPFEVARALTEYGVNVRQLYKNKVTPDDMETIRWLARHNPGLRVYSGDHPTHVHLRAENRGNCPVDIAIGEDAAYFNPQAHSVLYPLGEEPFGYRGVTDLFARMAAGKEGAR